MDATLTRQPLWRLALWGGIAAILLLPLIAMRFTREVQWTAGDFLFAGLLLGGAGLSWELAIRIRTVQTRVLLGGAILLAVLAIWVQGAVGVLQAGS